MLRLAEDAVAAEDAWAGFAGFLERAFEVHTHNRGVKDMLAIEPAEADAMRRADPATACADDRAGAGAGNACGATSPRGLTARCSGRSAA